MKKKIKKRLYILGLVSIVIVIISLFGFLIVAFRNPFKIYDPSFKQVNSFSRPVIFLNFNIFYNSHYSKKPEGGYVGFIGKKRGYKLVLNQIDEGQRGLFREIGIIGVRPDNESFFVSVPDKIAEIDSNLNIIREIPIKDFNFEPNNSIWEFTDFGAATNNTLWFGINRIKPTGEHTRELETSLVKWEFDKNPSTRIKVEAQAMEGITLDEAGGKIFAYGDKSLIYDLKTMTLEKTQQKYFWQDFRDFDPNHGLLISQTMQQFPGKIIKIDISTGKVIVVGEGYNAAWGYNGDIYYFDARRRLCRCSADGNNQKIITSGFFWKTNKFPLTPPKVSRDRTLLAYSINPFKGTLLLDLKKREYIFIKYYTFKANQMAWLVKE